ncbi:hypothetical protein CHLRE_03g195950v5 [Chlamydomonas reinhardtii]|uniref:Protein kinase domain-containing protein n=1 Tax=Chlamydomonas reinhardtii TaxID=3055 RepID=A0A2K3DYP1_CHLRE|nr:uncharacterized protein CHLRE_03g195950v5 [Chlamydomonas reinhardtii]PNW85639.1 hypothetical protein CHLRE_03g195950v5 [Chlamydomonas reinhardtii]
MCPVGTELWSTGALRSASSSMVGAISASDAATPAHFDGRALRIESANGAANLQAKPQQSPEAKATPSPGGDQAPFNSPRTQLSASGPRAGGATPRRLDLDFLEPEGNAISAPSPPGGKSSPQLPQSPAAQAPPTSSPPRSPSSALSFDVGSAIAEAISLAVPAMPSRLPSDSMVVLRRTSLEVAVGSNEAWQLDVLLAPGDTASGVAVPEYDLPGSRGGALTRMRCEKVLVVVRPTALAALHRPEPVLPKAIRTQVDQAAATSARNQQVRQSEGASQYTSPGAFPVLLGYDVQPVEGGNGTVLEFLTFWDCPGGYSIPVCKWLSPRMDKCDVLRQAIRSGIPNLCPPLVLDEVNVRSRTLAHSAGGGADSDDPIRNVEQLEVMMPDGRIAIWACKSVEVAVPAEDQAALSCGLVLVPTSFNPAVREVDAWVAVTQQLLRVRGEESLARCFPTMHGWDVLEPTPGTFKFVMYMEWMANGSARDFLFATMTSASVSDGEVYGKVLDTVGQLVDRLDECGRAGIVLGDFKVQNVLINALGEAKLSDPDGACPLEPHVVRAALTQSNQLEAEARAACTDCWGWSAISKCATAPVWEALAQHPAPNQPSMCTAIYAPPEFWVDWAAQRLADGAAAGHTCAEDLEAMRLEAQDDHRHGARDLVCSLQRQQCDTHGEALQQLQGMNGGRSYMCGASHIYLLGASMSNLLWTVEVELSARPGAAYAQRLAFVSELQDVMLGLMTEEPASRPSLQQLRRRLAEMRGDWCLWG